MSKGTKVRLVGAVMLFACVLCLVGCGNDAEGTLAASKYSSEVAQAIVEGSWKMAGAMFFGLILCGVLAG